MTDEILALFSRKLRRVKLAVALLFILNMILILFIFNEIGPLFQYGVPSQTEFSVFLIMGISVFILFLLAFE